MGAGFRRGHMGGFFEERVVEAAGLGDGDGENAPKAVNDVEADNQRDAETALFHGNLLQRVVLPRVVDHHAADQSRADIVLMEILFGG